MQAQAKIYIADSRNMAEVADESVHLVVTSPPYWHIKDYGVEGQIGYGQTLHEYLLDLSRVWCECWRVLKPGRRLCINIGDQFARAVIYGHYKVIPLHAEIIAQCETIGFDYMGAIIWRKKTTMRTTGGAVVMGSFCQIISFTEAASSRQNKCQKHTNKGGGSHVSNLSRLAKIFHTFP